MKTTAAKKASVVRKRTAETTTKTRSRNGRSGRIGSAARRSWTTKPASRAAPATSTRTAERSKGRCGEVTISPTAVAPIDRFT